MSSTINSDADAPDICLTTLGDLRLAVGGTETEEFSNRQLRAAVFVFLACERVTTRDKVLGFFWPDRDPQKARGAFNQTLYELRQELGQEWLSVHGDRIRVADRVRVDSDAFEQALSEADSEEALDLYTGHFLDGHYLTNKPDFENWVFARRDRLQRAHYDVCSEVVSGLERAGKIREATTAAGRWVDWYPESEEAQYCRVRLLAQSGRGPEAMRQYEAYKTWLEQELESSPGEAVWAPLLEDIRDGRVQAPNASGPTDSRSPRSGTELWGGPPLRGPRLVRISQGGQEGEAYRLKIGETTVGREKGDLVFPEDPKLSGRHATFVVELVSGRDEEDYPMQPRDCVYRVRDEGSTNGVFRRISNDWPLSHGDMFAVGQQVFRFERRAGRQGGEARGSGTIAL